MPSGASDTPKEVEAVVVARWRSMSIDERLSLVQRLCRDVDAIAVAGIRRSHPDASEREVRHELARRRYGSELADAAFSPNPAVS